MKKEKFTKDDLCVFLNEATTKIIQNIGAKNGGLKSFNFNFNFKNSCYTLTDKDIRSFRTRLEQEEE